MLRFEKLSLQGFKSFCDPTDVVFDEEGITAVVGPNGCGKSNVADAISWVIGEQRAKALRGGKMEDVIFQGTRSRPPSGMAEVILTLVVQETFEVRGEAQPESEALKQAEESLTQAEAAVGAIDEALASPEAEGDSVAETESGGAQSDLAESGQLEPAQDSEAQQESQRKQPRRPPFRKVQAKGAPRVFQAGERVTVGRRLYRTGESEYEMNGRARRYKRLRQEMRDLMRAVYVVDYRTTGKTLGEIETALNEVSAHESHLAATTAE